MFAVKSKTGGASALIHRSRWFIAAGALALQWSAWWYCADDAGSIAFFVAAVIISSIAVALPWTLPRNARWTIWVWVVILLVCLVTNAIRLAQPDAAIGDDGYVYDRVATALYSVGLCSLLFCAGRLQVTLVIIGCFTLLMRSLRDSSEGLTSWGTQLVVVWGFIIMAALFDVIFRATNLTSSKKRRGAQKKFWISLPLLTVVLLAAFFGRIPVEKTALGLQRMIYGLSVRPFKPHEPAFNGRSNLRLNKSLPKGFDERMRVIALVDASATPGYLRESVFTEYSAGCWSLHQSSNVLSKADLPAQEATGEWNRYPLLPGQNQMMTNDLWTVNIIEPKYLTRLCLPGNAVELWCADPEPLVGTAGMVLVGDEFSEIYGMKVVHCSWRDSACQRPDGLSDPGYLCIPGELAGAVSNWVEMCSGFKDADDPVSASVLLEHWFRTNFVYNMSARIRNRPDPLINFMTLREGFCIHFASAAALMLRYHGIPSRVVGGYVCCEWNSWLKRFVVRERAGHVWVEAWDEQRNRWIIVEPTPPGGLPSNQAPVGFFRLFADYTHCGWKRFTVWIQKINILSLLAEAGSMLFHYTLRLLLSPLGFVLAILAVFVMWRQRRKMKRRLSEDEQLRRALRHAMQSIERKYVTGSGARFEHECWKLWLERIKETLPQDDYLYLSEQVEIYQSLRYRKLVDADAAVSWMQSLESRCARPAKRIGHGA